MQRPKYNSANLQTKEEAFEKQCIHLIISENWELLYGISKNYLEDESGTSYKGFLFMGISFYKISEFENAI